MSAPPVSLYDVVDPLGFCRSALHEGLRRLGTTHLEWADEEDAHAHLVEALVKQARRFVPGMSPSFSTYAWRILTSFAVIDWYRKHRGDSRYGTWMGGRRDCQHGLNEEGRCPACGAEFVRNGGREQAAGDASEFVFGSSIDIEEVAALIDSIDHELLSPRVRGWLRNVAAEALETGATASEIASRHGKDRRDLTRDRDRARQELLELAP